MDFNIFTSKKLLWLAAGCILILAGVIFGPDKEIPEIEDENKMDLGGWTVTEVTGFVNYVVKGGSSWCDAKNENFYPIINDDQTFIKFVNGNAEPTLKNIPRDVFDTLNVMDRVKGLFLFQFSFDNGYDTNMTLESFNVPYHYTEVVKGLWTFEVGLWAEVPEFRGKGPRVYWEIISGNKWGGKRTVVVRGQIKSENRIEGQWIWDEVTAGPGNIPECEGKSYGSGNLVAVRK